MLFVRSFGGCLLHASATAFTGYGYGKTIIRKKSIIRVIPFFVVAVFAHALYNFLVSYDIIGTISGLILALLLAGLFIHFIRNKIRKLDLQNN